MPRISSMPALRLRSGCRLRLSSGLAGKNYRNLSDSESLSSFRAPGSLWLAAAGVSALNRAWSGPKLFSACGASGSNRRFLDRRSRRLRREPLAPHPAKSRRMLHARFNLRDHGEPDLPSRERLARRADSRRHVARLRGTGVPARERLGTCHASGFDWAFTGEDARATIPIVSKVELGLRAAARAKRSGKRVSFDSVGVAGASRSGDAAVTRGLRRARRPRPPRRGASGERDRTGSTRRGRIPRG